MKAEVFHRRCFRTIRGPVHSPYNCLIKYRSCLFPLHTADNVAVRSSYNCVYWVCFKTCFRVGTLLSECSLNGLGNVIGLHRKVS